MSSPTTEQDVRPATRNPTSEPAVVRSAALGRILSPVWDFFAFCRQHPRWSIGMSVLVLVWTTELYVVQWITLVPAQGATARFEAIAPVIRLGLDLLFISALCLALGRRWLYAILGVSFFAYLGMITYYQHFGRPISLLTILSQWSEGLQVSDAAVEEFPRGAALLLLATLAVKVLALTMTRRVSLPRPSAWAVATIVLLGYVGCYSATVVADPLHYITTTRGVGRLGYIRGYLGPWFAEWYYLNNDELLRRTLARCQEVCDGISPVEAPIPVQSRLVIVQVESLDTNILDYRVDGVEVTPFLNQLKNRSMYYRVRANHDFGSSDADFATLNGVLGSPDMNSWLLRDYPYEGTTPQLLADCGYKSTAFHGNSGEFYGRRIPYGKLGFDTIYFREDLDRDYDLISTSMGIADAEVFRLSAELLGKTAEPTCHFIITLTTHTPYTALRPEEQEIYPQPKSAVERYINNMRYMDNCLRDYVERLGSGTTVFLYADHPTEAATGFDSDRDASGVEYVPCMIFDADQDLSQVQRTRTDPRSIDGTWHLVDVVNYLRGQIKRSHGETPEGQSDSEAVAEEALAN